MRKNKFDSIFIVFDGPNGVGKTTVIENLKARLINEGYATTITSEPSNSNLGNLLRKESERLSGYGLASLVVANRYEHIEEIEILLQKYEIVLCDRYFLSTLILQGIDGVDEDFLININKKILKPDIQIVLKASQKTIQERLKERTVLTRFEENNKTELELKYLENGVKVLKNLNIPMYFLNTDEDISININKLIEIIQLYIKK